MILSESERGSDSESLEQKRSKTSDITHTAVRLLAGREHSRRELVDKLVKRGWSESDSHLCVEELANQDLQSDERFASSFLRSRAGKAYGPVRIRLELKERGIDRDVIEKAFLEESVDWLEVASRWYGRRYSDMPVGDIKERAKRQQALARRGFTHELIRELVD